LKFDTVIIELIPELRLCWNYKFTYYWYIIPWNRWGSVEIHRTLSSSTKTTYMKATCRYEKVNEWYFVCRYDRLYV